VKNDLLGCTGPYIRHCGDFIESTFGHMISFQATGETKTILGLDRSQQPLSIAWLLAVILFQMVQLVKLELNPVQKLFNDGLVFQKSDLCLPVVIAAYSSHLEITAGRNIQLFS
jgi:hypothetical protein